MKAISLYEPWATLIAIGQKKYETRSWSTAHRGSLLICAGMKKLPLAQIITILYKSGLDIADLNYGRAVCVADLVDVIPTEKLRPYRNGISPKEAYFGDFSCGRFAWKLDNIRRLNPFPVRGKQGLFDFPAIFKVSGLPE